MPDSPEIMGTVFEVDGTWYIRLLHGGGNLIKLMAKDPFRKQLVSGQTYKIEGYISRNHLGCDEACNASDGQALGKNN